MNLVAFTYYYFCFLGSTHDMSVNGRYYCENNCGRHYKNKRDMVHHHRHECGIPLPYCCNHCRMKFSKIYNLKVHVGLVHGAIYSD